MIPNRKLLILSILAFCTYLAGAQRTYVPNSVLSSGNWFKFSLSEEGVYKIDVPFLNSLGISGNIPSGQLRIFGNGGAMLPESNAEIPPDDLIENSIYVVDGGDGILNNNDYILFFAQGPDRWVKDSVNRRFAHQKNLYAEKSYYFLSVGGAGLRIATDASTGPAANLVNSFDERYFHELDTVNFLNSGKEWFGEEFSDAPGRTLERSFNLPLSEVLPQQATLITSVAARSVNNAGRFTISINNQPLSQVEVPPTGTGLYDLFAQQVQQKDLFLPGLTTVVATYKYQPGGFNSQGWLNWFEFFCRRSLTMKAGKQLLFRDWNSVGLSRATFNISNADNTLQVWEVTDPLHPVKMNTNISAGQLQFSNDAQRLKEYVSFSNFLVPQPVGKISNQNLHNTSEKELLIVTYPGFISEAKRLAVFHQQQNNMRTLVVTTDEVFNEFGSGTPDPTAIRDFVKMYFDRYKANWSQTGKYLLLFGKASFDYKNRIRQNTSLVPAYESASSLDPLSTYTSDDFFGFLDDAEDINSGNVVNQLDVGIGRIPSRNVEEAKNFVDKVMDYYSPSALGPWRNNLNFIADDEDNNLHLQDAEVITATVSATNPVFNQQKIYLDAYLQENASSGGRYPQVNAVVNSNIYNGTLLWNYNGHGGPLRLAEEIVIDQQMVNNWNNRYRLPLFITATCDFAPFDHPTINSLGENLLVRPRTGAIALMTTTRVVFAFSNRIINNNYLKFALKPDPMGRYLSLGEAVMTTKNYTYLSSGDITNNRKFTLLGDPAMTLSFPGYQIKLTKVNGKDITAMVDTLGASETAVAEGEVIDINGNLLNSFQGTAYLSLFDKPQTVITRGNDPSSQVVSFSDQQNLLFKGKATLQNGKFIIRFKIPRDINFQFGYGKFSLYAEDGTKDAHGFSNQVIIGGIATGTAGDDQGPVIRAYLNDEKFVNGSITNAAPILIVKLSDSSGINTGSSGIAHDIVATLDQDNNRYFVLNNFFETDLDNYQKGMLRFQLPELTPGPHTLHLKAWDLMNNSSEYQLDFTVVNRNEIIIDHVLNYPNPFTTKTTFWFEHNYPGTDLIVRADVFSVSGQLIKTIIQTINTPGNRSSELEWDGRDSYGNKVAKGVYIYRLRVKTPDGKTAEKWERLVILGK